MRAHLRLALALAVAALAAVGASPAPAGTHGTASFACTPAVFDTLSALTGSGTARLGDDMPRKEKDTESFTGDPADPVDQTAPGRPTKGAIPVYFHVVYASDGTGDVSRDVVRRQIDVLNITFGGMTTGHDTGFRFRLAGVDRTQNDAWFEQATLEDEVAMKSALKRGGSTELNIYSTSGGGFLGWSYHPRIVATKDAVLDGVVIHYGSMPGGPIGNYNLGYTATHEVGHYLGLAHTFQKGCKPPATASTTRRSCSSRHRAAPPTARRTRARRNPASIRSTTTWTTRTTSVTRSSPRARRSACRSSTSAGA